MGFAKISKQQRKEAIDITFALELSEGQYTDAKQWDLPKDEYN